MFLSGINEFYFKRDKHKVLKGLKHAASYMHAKSMYILGFIVIGDGDLTQGSTLIKEIFNSKGICHLTKCYTSLKSLSLMLSMKKHNFYRDILDGIEVQKYCYCVDCLV